MLWFFILFFKTNRDFCSNHRKYNFVYDQKWHRCMRFIIVIYSKHSIRLIFFFFHYTIDFIFLVNASKYSDFKIIQSIEKFENVFKIYRVCLSLIIQISFVHNITFHCKRIQLTCSWTKTNRKNLFFSKMNDFFLVNFRNIFFFAWFFS